MNLITESITSRNNPKVKNLVQLQKHGERISQNLIVIEGIREIEKALRAGYKGEQLFFNPRLIDISEVSSLFGCLLPGQIYQVSEEVFSKIAYRENSGGLVLLARPKEHSFSQISPGNNPLFLVIEGVEKPGNLGAIFRTADAAGVDAVIICDPRTDLYNPNAIRASLGCVFTVPTVLCNSPEAIAWLGNRRIQVLCTYLNAAVPYHMADYSGPTAIVMGTEATGISDQWVKASDSNLIIPMKGLADSLNVSTSAAIVVFEACRQRNFR
jgi:RNA methyltransferase, TrmH family